MHAEALTRTALSLPLAPRQPAPLQSPATGAILDALGVEGIRLRFGRNEEIFGEGEPASSVYRVLSGVVRTYRILADGRRQIAEFFLAGDVFGLHDGEEHRVSAEAVGDCEVLALRRGQLTERAATDAAVAQKLWALTLHCLRRSEEHMLLLGRKGACERVAWFLMDMSERIPAPRTVELLMSRQDIADYLGLTIETVSRSMTQLQDEGVITLQGARHVVLERRQALEGLAA